MREGWTYIAESFIRVWPRVMNEAREMLTEMIWELEHERQRRVALVTYAPGQADA